MASGSAFVSLACDVAGDHRSAAIARKVALGVVAPAPVSLIADLGRPERFLNMTRVFKPRSPMNTGAVVPARLQRLGRAGRRLRSVRPSEDRARVGRTDCAAWQLPWLLHRSAARLYRRSAVVAEPNDPRARHSSPPRPRPAPPPPASCSWRAACRTSIRRVGRSARSRPPRCSPSSRSRRSASAASEMPPRRSTGGARASTSAAPRALSPLVSRSDWFRAGPVRASTSSRASYTSRPVCCSASPGSTRAGRPRRRRGRGRGGAGPSSARTMACSERGKRAALSVRRSPLPLPGVRSPRVR